MSQVLQIQKEKDPIMGNLGSIFSTVGSVVGGIYGGPAGAAAGGAIGSQVGGAASDNRPPITPVQSDSSGLSDARMRAIQNKIDAANSGPILERAQEQLAQLDPETQQTLQPVINEALEKSRMQQEQMRQRRLNRTA